MKWEFFEAPSPQFWGSMDSKSPKIGGFREPSAALTMLRNNFPAASKLGDLGGLQLFSRYYETVRQQHLEKGDFDSDPSFFKGG